MKKTNKIDIIAKILIIAGILVFLYPIISNKLAEKNQSEIIESYEKIVSNNENIDIEKELKKAVEFNENLVGEPVHDPFIAGSGYALPQNYTDILNITDEGVMGYIKIPKISVNLPIYHGSSEEVMKIGIGHIETTSFPIGGKSTLSVLTGHRGLPSAELFTRLDELKTGDIFYINILNQKLIYKIYKTEVVLPTELKSLEAVSGKDRITLVTCTPYGVNTHRLLVHGERVEDININISEEPIEQIEQETTEININIIYYSIIFILRNSNNYFYNNI